jgi:hypothetical protein
MRFPTDDPELTDFICQVEGKPNVMKHLPAHGKGVLVISERNNEGKSKPWAIRYSNVLDEDYFQSDWPASAKVIDNRDAMHERGWTYFKISGRLNGERVSGLGRIPFVYAKSAQYHPWMKLQAGLDTIVDTKDGAYVYDPLTGKTTKYQAGSFFKGLARPWLGLHTIDIVRRDAAAQRIRFETRHTPGSRYAQVELVCEGARIVYTIDMETDVIDEITISTDQGDRGNLKFSYVQEVSEVIHGEFVYPDGSRGRGASKSGSGLLWLLQLAEGSLG